MSYHLSPQHKPKQLTIFKDNGRYCLGVELCFHQSFLFSTIPSFISSIFTRRSNRIPSDIYRWHAPQGTPLFHTTDTATVTWIGHSTFVVCIDGITIITDPIFGDLSFLYRRVLPPAYSYNQLPPIDVVLISHNHRDHMDAASLKAIKQNNKRTAIYVPEGDKRWFDRRNIPNTHEFTWWQHITIPTPSGKLIKFHFLPAIHWSQRGIFDRNKSLWGSWMIEHQDATIYFAGDTAQGPHFQMIGNMFPHIDLALMPIGPCAPTKWMRHTHLDAAQAVDAFIELGAYICIPMHWCTFLFGTDRVEDPYHQFVRSWNEKTAALPHLAMSTPKQGELITISRTVPYITGIVSQEVPI